MDTSDNFSEYYSEFLEGKYDCVDRIVINGYFGLGHSGGGFRTWWRKLSGSDDNLDDKHIQGMAGDFARRIKAFGKQHDIPVIWCKAGERKHLAQLQNMDPGQELTKPWQTSPAWAQRVLRDRRS